MLALGLRCRIGLGPSAKSEHSSHARTVLRADEISRLADIGGGASGRFVLGVLIHTHFLALSYTVSTHCFRKMRTLSSRKKAVAQIL
jgi:hypothetical protein